MPPQDSTIFNYTDQNYWQSLENQITCFQIPGTADLPDYIAPSDDILGDHTCLPTRIEYTPRNSRDSKVNEYGKNLCNITCNCSLQILNGRHTGDRLGSFSSIKTREAV